MNRSVVTTALAVLIVAAGCAMRFTPPDPVAYPAAALVVPDDAAAADVASLLDGARVVLLAADRDSAWFADVGSRIGRDLSGPGRARETSFAFLANGALGDTTLWLRVGDADSIPVHDALYEIEDERYVDLMVVGLAEGVDTRAAVGVLLEYVATDVMPNAAVLLGIVAPRTSGDTLAALLQPIFADARRCDDSAPSVPGMQLFYGPSARMRCDDVRAIAGEPPGIFGRFIVR